jgi:tRNA(Ile)-lysidine synthase
LAGIRNVVAPIPNPQSPIPNPQSLIPNPQSPNPCSPEAAARHARYAFLEQAAGRLGARYVVTAHTADDQAETILHRILRGTGIRGLAGMRRSRPLGPATLLRPLLGVRRAKLAAYLEQLGQPSRRDSSNRSLRFTRNRIRHRLLPHLAERFNPGVVDALLRLGTLAAESQTIIDRLVDDLAERSLRPGGPQTLRIARQKLEDQPKYLLGELLAGLWRRQGWPMQAMGHEKWELLAAMLGSGGQDPHTPRKVLFPGAVTVEIAGDELRATRTPPPG